MVAGKEPSMAADGRRMAVFTPTASSIAKDLPTVYLRYWNLSG